MQTKGVRSSLAQAARRHGHGRDGGAARYSDYADAANYVYTIYVKIPTSPARRSSWALSTLTGFKAARRFVPRGFSMALCVPRGTDLILRRHGEWLGEMPPIGRHLIKCAGPRPRWPQCRPVGAG